MLDQHFNQIFYNVEVDTRTRTVRGDKIFVSIMFRDLSNVDVISLIQYRLRIVINPFKFLLNVI